MKDNSFYIPVEMEAVPEITNKIDFYVEEKFDFAHADTPEEDATLTIKKNDVTIANFRASDKFDTTANITVPTKTSDLLNDSGLIVGSDVPLHEIDPTVPSWAKQVQKPTYTASEVHALPDSTVIPTVPTNVSAFTNDSGYITANDVPVKSVDGKTGEVVVEKVTKLQQDLDCTYQIVAESIDSNGFYGTNSFIIGGTKTLSYIDGRIYKDSDGTQPATFPNTVMLYATDYMGWDIQIINFQEVITAQEIKLYKLCKLNLLEISENIYASTIGSIEFIASDGSTLIWYSNGEVEIL